MKKVLRFISVLCFVVPLLYLSVKAYAGESQSLPASTNKAEIKITPELKEKYHIKPVHEGLSFKCIFCHEGQGDQAEKFTYPDEEICLSCHKTKQYIADRLSFMDTLKANPHNSIHDGPNLYCDECHKEHKPSVNMCTECHEKEIKENIWMRKVP